MRLLPPTILAAAIALLTGCMSMPEQNSGLGATSALAKREDDRMQQTHVPLARRVVVLNGYRGLPSAAKRRARHLAELTSGDRADFLPISYTFDTDVDRITRAVIAEVEKKWPSADPGATVPVDVVAISMGGVVARWAALPPDERLRDGAPGPLPERGKRLNIVHLYTLGSPHRGATLADVIAPDPAARDMIARSGFLRTLDAHRAEAQYELICYATLRDGIVGATHCAPEGCTPIWTSGRFMGSHLKIGDNDIFQADIARRLRGEEPLLHQAGPPPRD